MDSPFIMLMVACGIASVPASMTAVFIGRRWLGISFGSALSELRLALLAGVWQGVFAPINFAGGLLSVFSIGLLPVWAVFALAHRDRWELLDGFSFSALQSVMLLFLSVPWLIAPALR